MADIIKNYLDNPTLNYDAYSKGDIDGGNILKAWFKMDDATKKQLTDLADGLVSETAHHTDNNGKVTDYKNVFMHADDGKNHPEASMLSLITGAITSVNPEKRFSAQPGSGFEANKSAVDKKPTADVGKKLREAYLASKAPKAK